MKTIELTQSYRAIVDDEDYEHVNASKWRAAKRANGYYPERTVKLNGKVKNICLSTFIMNPKEGMEVDHINNDPLDNRKSNLRICTHLENCRNRSWKGKYKGVYPRLNDNFYISMIRVDQKLKYLGWFKSQLLAAYIYNLAAIKYFGEYAKLNHLEPDYQELGEKI